MVLTDEAFKKANVKLTQMVDVLGSVKETEIDTIYFEKPYYLEPGKGASKAYSILSGIDIARVLRKLEVLA